MSGRRQTQFDKQKYVDGIKRAQAGENHETEIQSRWIQEEFIPQKLDTPVIFFIDDKNGETINQFDDLRSAMDTMRAINGHKKGYSLRSYAPTEQEYTSENRMNKDDQTYQRSYTHAPLTKENFNFRY